MFLLRPAESEDLPALLELAQLLDSPNLPADETFLAKRIEHSRRAFAEGGPPAPEREYQLVLTDGSGRVTGTSAILAKHGTPEMPHVYLRVGNEERVAADARIRVTHRTLQLGAERDGPSELGALILHPDARGRPGWPGKLLSWGRFTYIALHPERFEDRLLAEMRACFDAEGRNAFWHAFGERFTGMSYEEADRRSVHDKSFILDLFPSTPFYASLLDDEAVAQLGQVHDEARPALRLLERAGLRWIGEIDPFDAGPFYGAATRDVTPVRETAHGFLSEEEPGDGA
ncbi:MAG: arginine N-succinyltransferase, partial [Myxococcota bacterium]